MWRVCKAAGRPWPKLSDDDVIDYMVMEAVALKINREDERAAKAVERRREQKEAEARLRKQFG